MGERLLCKQEVDGSIPFTSTTADRTTADRSCRARQRRQGAARARKAAREAGCFKAQGLTIGRSRHCRLALPVWAVARPAFDL